MTPPEKATPREPWYLQITDLVGDLFTSLNDEDKRVLIIKAEEVIDDLVGVGHLKYYSKFYSDEEEWQEQFTTFPRLQDYELDEDNEELPVIAESISTATLLVCEVVVELDQNSTDDVADTILSSKFDEIKIGEAQTRRSAGNSRDSGNNKLSDFVLETTKGKQADNLLIQFKKNYTSY